MTPPKAEQNIPNSLKSQNKAFLLLRNIHSWINLGMNRKKNSLIAHFRASGDSEGIVLQDILLPFVEEHNRLRFWGDKAHKVPIDRPIEGVRRKGDNNCSNSWCLPAPNSNFLSHSKRSNSLSPKGGQNPRQIFLSKINYKSLLSH